MLNNNKIHVMTKLAMYEKNEGKKDIKLGKYYRTDYVRFHALKTIVSVTIGYLLILLMIVAYKAEYIISKAVTLDYKAIGTYVIGIYIILLAVYMIVSIIAYSIQYDSAKKRLVVYYKNLKLLRKLYKQEESEQK
ncbi:hypothetical protein [Anaeromicropila herbilytica]|uniref:Uncharacterized protein n=1 Tax=Anaeromicropila herbilytica TaxID=2785025 RepID=A0A7R7EJ91_9FIRM|nr:hypothetical protein [Anaeromicropila herbilytica]BCN29775.1 hypothetical protein bsdtb5_10700 [Anaeromicropila herbilytica]